MSASRRARIVASAASVLMVIGLFVDRTQFFRSYLYAFLFWMGLGLGCLAVYMLHNLTGGNWGVPIRRILEAGARTLKLLALMLVPILFGVGQIYEWSHADQVAADPILQHKAAYLNVPFFTIRSIFYFVVWIALGTAVLKFSRRYEDTGDPRYRDKRATVSAAGILIYVLTMTFASIDWAMSVEAHWFSTVYGLSFVVSQVLGALCLCILVASQHHAREPAKSAWTADQFNDTANLTLAFVMLWAYIALSQFLIIWSGNLPEETPWYLHRTAAGWQSVALIVILIHFAVPFLLLLARRNKRSRRMLARLTFGMLIARAVDTLWTIAPGFHPEEFHLSWMDFAAMASLGGFWIWHFTRNLESRSIVYEPPAEAGSAEATA